MQQQAQSEKKKEDRKKRKEIKSMIKNSGKEKKNVVAPQRSFLKYGER
jgi:hypothetical protein